MKLTAAEIKLLISIVNSTGCVHGTAEVGALMQKLQVLLEMEIRR